MDKDALFKEADEMASDGLRVLALARKKIDKEKLEVDDCLSGITFVGLQGMIDPPRKEAIARSRRVPGSRALT